MYDTTSASLPSHASRSAMPRPLTVSTSARTRSCSASSSRASSLVPSFEPLSAITSRQSYRGCSSNRPSVRSTLSRSTDTSL